MRGDVYALKESRGAVGHEQQGRRYAVVLQADELPLSTCLVAPTSTRARPTSFRPEIELMATPTMVMVEQTAAVDLSRLGERVGRVTLADMQQIEDALRAVLRL